MIIKYIKAKNKEHARERQEEETIKILQMGSEVARGRRGRRWPATNRRGDEMAARGFLDLLVPFPLGEGGTGAALQLGPVWSAPSRPLTQSGLICLCEVAHKSRDSSDL